MAAPSGDAPCAHQTPVALICCIAAEASFYYSKVQKVIERYGLTGQGRDAASGDLDPTALLRSTGGSQRGAVHLLSPNVTFVLWCDDSLGCWL